MCSRLFIYNFGFLLRLVVVLPLLFFLVSALLPRFGVFTKDNVFCEIAIVLAAVFI